MQKKPGPLCDSRQEALADMLRLQDKLGVWSSVLLISAGVWVSATHINSVTQLYGADGAEGFFLLVNKCTSKCFALVSFEYEPYSVSPP